MCSDDKEQKLGQLQRRTTKKMHSTNKIIIKTSVKFYSEVWKHRNKVKHDTEKFNEFAMKWLKNAREIIANDNRPEMLQCVRMNQLNAE